jgi:cell fate regulator YaaT (PSP1 superfamily)
MPLVVGVTFRRVGKVYYFDPGEIGLREGDFVIAETARGVEFGEVVLEPRNVPEEELVAPLKRIVRVATGDDLDREAANRDREKHALEVCEQKIAQHGLPMKLLEVEYAFDGSQVTFSFGAEGRVDFRDLVKDVAGALKTKVQLHQIGVRDEAKLIGGYGTCGRPLCCATFLNNFDPVSMKMAKDQSLFLNPAKFSGACGKLMCCLRFEHEFYKSAQKRLPAVGAIVPLDERRAKVIDVNVVSNMITVQTEEDVQLHIHASKLNLAGLCRRHGIGCNTKESNCEVLVADEYLIGEPTEEDEGKTGEVRFDDRGTAGFGRDTTDEVATVTQWRSPGGGNDGTRENGYVQDKGNARPGGNGDRSQRRGHGRRRSPRRPRREDQGGQAEGH